MYKLLDLQKLVSANRSPLSSADPRSSTIPVSSVAEAMRVQRMRIEPTGAFDSTDDCLTFLGCLYRF